MKGACHPRESGDLSLLHSLANPKAEGKRDSVDSRLRGNDVTTAREARVVGGPEVRDARRVARARGRFAVGANFQTRPGRENVAANGGSLGNLPLQAISPPAQEFHKSPFAQALEFLADFGVVS